MKKLIIIFFLGWITCNAQYSMFWGQNYAISSWNILNATYNQSFNVSAQESYQRDIYVLNDTCMFVCATTNSKVYQYSIGVSSLTYRKSITVASNPEGIDFKSNGTIMYIASGNSIYEYTLTAWDISTASLSKSKDFSTYSQSVGGVKISADGYHVIIGSHNYSDLNMYVLSTAWDISTATSVSYEVSLSVSAHATTIYDFRFGQSGMLIAIANSSYLTIVVYSVTTAYTLTGATYLGSLNVNANSGSPYGIGFNSTGTKMYVSGNNSGYIYQYNL